MELSGLLQKRLALLFPGQGSQHVGMGQRVHQFSEAARRVFAQAEEILGMPLRRLCFEGPVEELTDTANAQPAILTVSLAYLEAIRERLHELGTSLQPLVLAGHSLGEFTALVAANALRFEDALRLVRERGRLMREASLERPGGMAAVLGLEREALEAVCREASELGLVVVANDNAPGQLVISGEERALQRAMELAAQRGAKRVVRLGVTVASHSPLMERVAQALAELLARIPLREPEIPIVANVTGRILSTVEEIRRELAGQVALPVQWTATVREMRSRGVTTFLEVGPGQVLTGLVKKIQRDVEAYSMKDLGFEP
ncbi:ACP S-malonyltransferase [Thermomicrobium sp. 4228-Ro]|uniref:ACP S-malonyltransferase n=1 Tax=Thermomicrobium sp. 4228-Ro TaxID=2993937 RepID=UPI00224974E8|nr:ACP S-malonyltransferase [Thermomicrobium sp. 4228-Ro]MCX2727748.1 ACP S-malonyltransferase [Thermomicrobium sp. 4228-Ro]